MYTSVERFPERHHFQGRGNAPSTLTTAAQTANERDDDD